MLPTLPPDLASFTRLSWVEIEPFYQALLAFDLTPENATAWCDRWSQLEALATERLTRLMIAQQKDTRDTAIAQALQAYRGLVFGSMRGYSEQLAQKLRVSGLIPAGYEEVMQVLRSQEARHVPANEALIDEEYRLLGEHSGILEAHKIEWEGETLRERGIWAKLRLLDRPSREAIFRAFTARQLKDREALIPLWRDLRKTRLAQVQNAGLPSYAAYVWRENSQTDFTPEDMLKLHGAIAEVVIPAANRVYENYRQRMNLPTLRPYDFTTGWYARPVDEPDTRPFINGAELAAKCAGIFKQMDAGLGAYFQSLIDDDLLDLDAREGKATVGFSGNQLGLAVSRKSHIMMNVSGTDRDVRVLLHESGHAFAVCESADLPFLNMIYGTSRLTEFPSMAMELLAGDYLPVSKGGFYSETDFAQARTAHLEELLLWMQWLAILDAFGHWAYSSADADDPAKCDAQWLALHKRFMPSVDWAGFEAECASGWLWSSPVWWTPFFMMEYVIALIGAVQLWQIARINPAAGMAHYRAALRSRGGIPQMFAAAGANYALDAALLKQCVEVIEGVLKEIER